MALKTYRDLEVWQTSMELVEETYRISQAFPDEEKFGLTSQLRRAAVSIPANIAEGYGRMHRGDYVRHLSIANGSLTELETLLTLTVRLNLIKRETAMRAWELMQQVGKMLNKLIAALKPQPRNPEPGSQNPGPGFPNTQPS